MLVKVNQKLKLKKSYNNTVISVSSDSICRLYYIKKLLGTKIASLDSFQMLFTNAMNCQCLVSLNDSFLYPLGISHNFYSPLKGVEIL